MLKPLAICGQAGFWLENLKFFVSNCWVFLIKGQSRVLSKFSRKFLIGSPLRSLNLMSCVFVADSADPFAITLSSDIVLKKTLLGLACHEFGSMTFDTRPAPYFTRSAYPLPRFSKSWGIRILRRTLRYIHLNPDSTRRMARKLSQMFETATKNVLPLAFKKDQSYGSFRDVSENGVLTVCSNGHNDP